MPINIPPDVIQTIGLNLSIPDLKSLASCYSTNLFNNYRFLRIYIEKHYKDYVPCEDLLLWQQLKYIHKMYIMKGKATLFDYKSEFQLIPSNWLTPIEQKLGIKATVIQSHSFKLGDAIKMDNELYVYCGNNLLKSINYKYCGRPIIVIPQDICFIDNFPLNWFPWQVCCAFVFYLDVTPYLDQIERNLRRVNDYFKIIYKSSFIHKYGKEYQISYFKLLPKTRLTTIDTKVFIMDTIKKGYFLGSTYEDKLSLLTKFPN